jgi:uncharacterized protein YprB with RNaseH-like and TPR domain/DNA-directed RNA polymerase subunit RPC12/RpoP
MLGYAYQLYDTQLIHVVRESFILAFAFKWAGESKIHVRKLPDYPLYKKDQYDDTALLRDLHSLIDSADIVVAHNGDRFDIRVAKARFIQKGLDPLGKKLSIDTLKVARSQFKFSSNKLDDLARFAGVKGKIETEKGLSIKCIDGDLKAWKKYASYCKQDVWVLDKVYEWMKPWMLRHPNANLFNETYYSCPTCGSSQVIKRGFAYTATMKYQKYRCKDCRSWSCGTMGKLDGKVGIK